MQTPRNYLLQRLMLAGLVLLIPQALKAQVVSSVGEASDGLVAASQSQCGDSVCQCGSPCDATGSCSRCDACGGGWFDRTFGRFFLPTDRCFDEFVSPMTNPVYFEDPRVMTEAKVLFIQHRVPAAAAGGSVQLYALQVQVALTDRLAIVADKDGYIVSQNPLIADGFADVAAGLKYNFYADYERQRLASVGVSYEMPVGSTRSLQGNGSGEFHLYLTGAARLGCDWHWISATGFRLPADTVDESQMWYWSNHLDRRLTDRLYAFGEVNWYHWLRSGQQTALAGVEGGDLFNFGSTGVAGNDIVTGALGVKLKTNSGGELGFAWEIPLTDRRDVLQDRLTVDYILRY